MPSPEVTDRLPGRRLAVLAGLAGLAWAGWAGCSGSPSSPPPESSSTPEPTIVVAGEPVPVARMTDALENLCAARAEAPDRPRAAEARFFDRSHETLHVVARALEDVDRALAGQLLEAKQKVEADFSGLASADRVADDLGRLVDVTAEGLDRLAVPTPPCAK